MLLSLDLNDPEQVDQAIKIFKALALRQRLDILRLVARSATTPNEIAARLEAPQSTITLNVRLLEQAGLLTSSAESTGVKGLSKVLEPACDRILIHLPRPAEDDRPACEYTIPVGSYTAFEVSEPCGLCSETGIIGSLDDPLSFYEPARSQAQLIWFYDGYIEYSVPNRIPPRAEITAVGVSLELCSEAPGYNLNWPSDITLWLNGVEIGTWTSPGDFGGRPGLLTPTWWTPNNTQYGLMKQWSVSQQGSYIDGVRTDTVRLDQLSLKEHLIRLRIGVKRDAVHRGGVSIFGARFGNYPQDIRLTLSYVLPQSSDVRRLAVDVVGTASDGVSP